MDLIWFSRAFHRIIDLYYFKTNAKLFQTAKFVFILITPTLFHYYYNLKFHSQFILMMTEKRLANVSIQKINLTPSMCNSVSNSSLRSQILQFTTIQAF